MPEIQTNNDLHIELLRLKKAALVYRAINHSLRQQMLLLLHSNLRMRVSALYVELKLEQSVASQHLGILRKAGLVNTQREGKNIFYSVNYQKLKEVHQHAGELLKTAQV